MYDLTQAKCIPCQGGLPPLNAQQIDPYRSQVPEWEVAEEDGIMRLRRRFDFPDFKTAMDFAVAVGELAEQEQHHPDLHVAWGSVVVETWTHKIGGLHENDFILAAKIDQVASARRR